MKATIKIVKQYDKHENTILLAMTSSAFKDDQFSLTDFLTLLHHNSSLMKLDYDCHPPSGLREFKELSKLQISKAAWMSHTSRLRNRDFWSIMERLKDPLLRRRTVF